LYDAYYQGADAAIIMFDCTCRNTYKGVSAWYDAFTRVCGYDIPVVVVGNKAEPGRKVMPRHITFPFNNNLPYYDMSIKRNSCVEMPLTLLVFWFESKVAMQQLHQLRQDNRHLSAILGIPTDGTTAAPFVMPNGTSSFAL